MLPQFDVATYPSQVFWLLISFSIVIGGMIFFVLPKYQSLIDARIRKIKNEVDTAVYLQNEVITLKKERIQRMLQAEEEAKIQIENATKKIMQEQIDQIKQIKKSHEILVGKLEASIEKQKIAILDNIKPFLHSSAEDILEKLKDVKNAS